MKIVQVKRVKICGPTKYMGFLIAFMMLASCSSSQHAFFAQRDALISQGYTWQKLERCRPAKEDALVDPGHLTRWTQIGVLQIGTGTKWYRRISNRDHPGTIFPGGTYHGHNIRY